MPNLYFFTLIFFVTFTFPQATVSFAVPVFVLAVSFTLLPEDLLNFSSFFPLASSFQVIFPFSPFAAAVKVIDFFRFTVVFPLTFSEGFSTVILQVAYLTLLSNALAVIVAVPGAIAVTFPLVLLTDATEGLLLVNVTFWEADFGVIVAFSWKLWYTCSFLELADNFTLLANGTVTVACFFCTLPE